LKRRRSTVYVQPGKDVTLYVPVETPPEVIDYLNHLKAEGVFSQGVIEMITQYVQQRSDIVPAQSSVATGYDSLDSDVAPAESDSEGRRDQPLQDSTLVTGSQKLNLSQIFEQAQRNAEKLIDS
jgi:hypothetical protein